MHDKIFYSICIGFVFGVLLRSFLLINSYLIYLFSFLSLSSVLFFIFISKDKWRTVISVFILVSFLGIIRFNFYTQVIPSDLEKNIGKEINLSGLIVDEPDIRENNQKLTVLLIPSNKKQKIKKINRKKILLTVNTEEEFKYGDNLKFRGVLKEPENFITDQGKEFDYIHYLEKEKIFYLMFFPEVEKISENHGNKIKNTLFLIKNKFLKKINLFIRKPESKLMGGLILGERASFDKKMRQKFIDTGTIHIVALSGYNVTIIAEWIMKIFSFLPRNLGFSFGVLGIILFVVMSGGQSTAIRAGIMAVLALIARSTGRNYDVARALVLAGAIMIFFNPLLLRYDVSFQLSFIATVAVIFLAPKFEKYFLWVTKKFELRDIVSVTFSAYIFVLPFILYKMGNLSLVALPANILILPFIPVTMLFGFLTGFLGIIWYVLAVPFGYISYIFLHYELGIINILSNVPFSAFSVQNFPLIVTILIYIYFFYKLFGKSIKNFFLKI